jgi:hypothetical protein
MKIIACILIILAFSFLIALAIEIKNSAEDFKDE